MRVDIRASKMSDRNSNWKRLKPIRESRLLPRLAVEQLRTMIHNGELADESQLPSELELAKALNISRSTLRAALSYLENEGTIIRRIEQSPVEFDLREDKLEELRKRRVTDKVLAAMKAAMGTDSK